MVNSNLKDVYQSQIGVDSSMNEKVAKFHHYTAARYAINLPPTRTINISIYASNPSPKDDIIGVL